MYSSFIMVKTCQILRNCKCSHLCGRSDQLGMYVCVCAEIFEIECKNVI